MSTTKEKTTRAKNAVAPPARVQPVRLVTTTRYKELKVKRDALIGASGARKSRARADEEWRNKVLDIVKAQKKKGGLSFTDLVEAVQEGSPATKPIRARVRRALGQLTELGEVRHSKNRYAEATEEDKKKRKTKKQSHRKKAAAVVPEGKQPPKKKAKRSKKEDAAAPEGAEEAEGTPKKKKRAAPKKKKSKKEASAAPAEAGAEGPAAAAPSSSGGGAHWEYLDQSKGGWHSYDQEASEMVEGVYQEFLKNPCVDIRSVKSGQWAYQVDFTNLKQTNIQHESHTVRDIRRVDS